MTETQKAVEALESLLLELDGKLGHWDINPEHRPALARAKAFYAENFEQSMLEMEEAFIFSANHSNFDADYPSEKLAAFIAVWSGAVLNEATAADKGRLTKAIKKCRLLAIEKLEGYAADFERRRGFPLTRPRSSYYFDRPSQIAAAYRAFTREQLSSLRKTEIVVDPEAIRALDKELQAGGRLPLAGEPLRFLDAGEKLISYGVVRRNGVCVILEAERDCSSRSHIEVDVGTNIKYKDNDSWQFFAVPWNGFRRS